MKDKVFLLKPGFMDRGEGPYFCPGCVIVEGMLSFYPSLRDNLEINYIDFPRPRSTLVALIGEENKSCPKLILGGDHQPPSGINVNEKNRNIFISDPWEICRYLGKIYGTGLPHD